MERPTFPSIKNLWYRMSLRVKLLFFFVVIVVAVTVIGLYSYTVAYRYTDEFQETLQSHYRINSFLLDLRKDYETLNTILKSTLPVDLAAVRERQEKLNVQLDWINRESNTSEQAYFQINALRNALGVYIEKANESIREYSEGGKDYFQSWYMAQRIYSYMEKYLSDLQQIRLSEGWLYYYSLSRRSETTRSLVIGIIACVALLSLPSLSFFLGISRRRSIRSPNSRGESRQANSTCRSSKTPPTATTK